MVSAVVPEGLDDPRPPIRWVETITPDGWRIVRAEHDGPCVFVDHQCSCGKLDIGIVS